MIEAVSSEVGWRDKSADSDSAKMTKTIRAILPTSSPLSALDATVPISTNNKVKYISCSSLVSN